MKANLLNQYTNRTVPGAVDIMGVSFATNTVTVNGQTAYRKGEYFRKELPVANTSGPAWTNITASATGQTSVSGYSFVPKTPEQFWYDTDGNLTNDGRWKYTWDAENRLVRLVSGTATGPQQRIEFGYDTRGRRITKKMWNNTAGTGTPALDQRFIYDDWNLLAELNATNNAVIRAYTWGLDLSGTLQGAGGVGGLLAVLDTTGGTNFCTFDGNGNVSALVSATNSVATATYEYGPFGEAIRATGPMAKANRFRFSTKYLDDESDIVMYPRRPYSASTGRWLSRDPAAEAGGCNIYSFVRNRMGVDPFGLAELRYIDSPKWQLIEGWDAQYPREFLWVGHYMDFNSSDASLIGGSGVMLVNHRSSAIITDCQTQSQKSLVSKNWYFANRFNMGSDGTVTSADNYESFGNPGAEEVVGNYLFTQIANFGLGMPELLRKYGGQSGEPGWTKGILFSRMEIHIISAGAYDIASEPWQRPPRPDGWMATQQVGIEGHEHSRGYYGRMEGQMPMSFTAASAYSVTLNLVFRWDDCCGLAKWDFQCSPSIGEPGLQRWRYRDANHFAVDLLERPNSGTW